MSYLLGVPHSATLLPRRADGSLLPCRHCNAIPDVNGHHKQVCRYCGKKSAHDLLNQVMTGLARPACIGYSTTSVPCHDDSNKTGDALLSFPTSDSTTTHAVADFTMRHMFSGTGTWNDRALQDAHNQKVAKHRIPYQRQDLSFIPCVASTYGVIGADFLRLLYVMARKQAEVIVTHHRPDTSYRQIVGYCFTNNRVKLGAAIARAMAMRALSYTKLGVRRPWATTVSFPAQVEQDLHLWDGIRGSSPSLSASGG